MLSSYLSLSKVPETMCATRSLVLSATMCYFLTGPHDSVAGQKKTSCRVHDGRADCSHLSLSAVPPDLPGNLTSLDMSHNRLKGIPPASLTPYPGLLHLDVNYNSITKLDGGVCKTLPLLQTLHMGHNEVLYLKKEDLCDCARLTQLVMASNRLRLQGEPFSALQVRMSVTQDAGL